MYVCQRENIPIKLQPFSLSEHDVTSQILLKEAEDECALQAAGGRREENTL